MCGCVFLGEGVSLEVWVFVREGECVCLCLCVLGAASGVCIGGLQ